MKTFTFATSFALLAASSALALPTEQAEKRSASTFDDGNYTGIRGFVAYPTGTWTHLTNQGSSVYDGTESYSHDKDASYRFLYEGESSVKIYAAKKTDRGYFDVYIGGKKIGTGDANGSCTGNHCKSALVFQASNLNVGTPDDSSAVVKNRATDSRVKGVPYLAFDKSVTA